MWRRSLQSFNGADMQCHSHRYLKVVVHLRCLHCCVIICTVDGPPWISQSPMKRCHLGTFLRRMALGKRIRRISDDTVTDTCAVHTPSSQSADLAFLESRPKHKTLAAVTGRGNQVAGIGLNAIISRHRPWILWIVLLGIFELSTS